MTEKDISKIENIIGCAFKDKTLLERAFVHSSYANEHDVCSYERLEFLGDGVLGLIVAEMLYKADGDEGVMTVRRSMIVSSEPLEDATVAAGLSEFVLYGNGERNNDHSDSKVLADVFEAVLGAVYLDTGYEKAAELVERFLGDRIREVMTSGKRNYKGELQEYCQAHKLKLAEYGVTESERDGRPHFAATVRAAGVTARGEGRRKRDAEQEAAKYALEKLHELGK